MPSFECRACGACCYNPESNRAEGFVDWVEIDPRDVLLQRPRFAKKLVVLNAEGQPHLRVNPDGRCAALRGQMGKQVTCSIYFIRPRACHRVQPGDETCRTLRQARGLD